MFERKKERNGEIPSRHIFKSICVFSELNVGNNGEFLIVASDISNALIARKINFVYRGGIQDLRGNAIISTSTKGSKILGVIVKELDNKIFCIFIELRVLSLPK